MSIRLMTTVWGLRLPTAVKMVLLVLADHANDDGTEARPSMDTQIEYTGMDRRTVQRHLRDLQDRGMIVLDREAAQHRTRVYRLTLAQGRQNATPARGGSGAPRGGNERAQGRHSTALPTPTHQDPPLASASQPPLIADDTPPEDAPAPRKPRARDPLWDALTEYFGETTNGAEASRRGKAVRDLKESGATAEQVGAACRTAARWGWEHFTELAIASNWRRLCADDKEAEPSMYELQSGRRQR